MIFKMELLGTMVCQKSALSSKIGLGEETHFYFHTTLSMLSLNNSNSPNPTELICWKHEWIFVRHSCLLIHIIKV